MPIAGMLKYTSSMRILISALLLIMLTPAAVPLAAQGGPPPCEQPAFAHLRPLAGTWTVQARTRLSRDAKDWEESAGQARIELLMRDCALLERYESTRRGRPYEGLRLFAVKAEGQRVQMVITDSEHGPLFLYEGEAAAGELNFYTSVTTPAGPVRLRLRYSEIGPDRFVAESQRSVDEGKTWDTTSRSEYRRRPPEAPRSERRTGEI